MSKHRSLIIVTIVACSTAVAIAAEAPRSRPTMAQKTVGKVASDAGSKPVAAADAGARAPADAGSRSPSDAGSQPAAAPAAKDGGTAAKPANKK